MLFCLIMTDKPEAGTIRAATRDAHLAYLRSFGERIRIAGPVLSEDAQSPVGSMIIFDAADLVEARRFADADPYTTAGLFAEVSIRPWRLVIGPQGF